MEIKTIKKLIYSSAIASILAIVFVVKSTILGEISPAFQAAIKGLTGHHWISKSVLTLVIYLAGLTIFYYLPPKNIKDKSIHCVLTALIWLSLAGIATIFLFFVGHYRGLF